jgi:ribosomal protein L22
MTEKNYNPEQKGMKTMQKQQAAATQKVEAAQMSKEEKKGETKKQEVSASIEDSQKTEEKKQEDKKEKKAGKVIIKKDEAIVNGVSLPISTKVSAAICKFIKRKSIEKAIADLEEVLKFKKVVPMTGDIPHKKGKGIMSGRYPQKATKYFIIMLKNLNANAIVNGIEEGVIAEAIPNRASQPYGRGGSIRRKRTHVKIKVVERKLKEKKY